VGSMILWGPPGSGKTTLARLIARVTSSHFVPLSAVSAGVADLRRNIEEARLRRAQSGKRTILFIDEIHRFNKGQQDAVLPLVEEAVQRKNLLYDRAGEEHYNIISALHKSLRDSDPDASLYWLGRMLEAGEDPLYVARRLIRFASEDIGLADPQALTQAVAAQQAAHFIGIPEANLALAQAVVYLATAPKSNALYAAYASVQEDVERTRADPVPLHLR